MISADPARPPAEMIAPFPSPGRALAHAYRELSIAANGTADQRKALGDLRMLPRPWDPATCTQPALRRELWQWLEAVVTWLNTEYVWDVTGVIPACWPQHPHLVHEVAVLADQRRRAGLSFASDGLEEWHRYALPAFVERMKSRARNHCEEGHQPWPAKGRFVRHTGQPAADARAAVYEGDVASVTHSSRAQTGQPQPLRLTVVDDGSHVDPSTGEVVE